MATFLSTSATGNREDIYDIISMISPQDTPLYSMSTKTTAENTYHQWVTDALRTPKANAQAEGADWAYDAITPVTKVGNHTQIFRETGRVSMTQENVNTVGNANRLAREKMKAGLALRKDVELSIISDTASVAGGTRVSGGLPTWITTNAVRGTGGAGLGFNSSGNVTRSATEGTQTAFSKAKLDEVLQEVYTSGGNARYVVCSPYIKSVIANFISDNNVATLRTNVQGSERVTLTGTVDIYRSPHGEVDVVPDRVMGSGVDANAKTASARNVFVIDPDHLSWAWLRGRRIKEGKTADTGDAVQFALIGEGCLMPTNEAAFGVVADNFGVNASS